ncbi:hypothetical protein F8C86_23035 [Escherichia coli]|uniref:hypothetical protein n=1 Tax=Escherichia coli TaxID=562 RepID=UPI00124E6641|nr:hypothetical protein [Escherichia coli]KAB2827012.1 hypothetical protein F8C86_23035 [Escherichia coli]
MNRLGMTALTIFLSLHSCYASDINWTEGNKYTNITHKKVDGIVIYIRDYAGMRTHLLKSSDSVIVKGRTSPRVTWGSRVDIGCFLYDRNGKSINDHFWTKGEVIELIGRDLAYSRDVRVSIPRKTIEAMMREPNVHRAVCSERLYDSYSLDVRSQQEEMIIHTYLRIFNDQISVTADKHGVWTTDKIRFATNPGARIFARVTGGDINLHNNQRTRNIRANTNVDLGVAPAYKDPSNTNGYLYSIGEFKLSGTLPQPQNVRYSVTLTSELN